MASGGSRLTREEFKKERALEEARKTGAAPLARDEKGKEINPHIPSYIAQAPWYLNDDTPSLKHQKTAEKNFDKKWYVRGVTGQAATKFRKGACRNCGAMTHTEKFCCERPRKIGAKYTGMDIAPDEIVQDLTLSFEGKRDRWNGYDPEDIFNASLEQHEVMEQERQNKKKSEEAVETTTDAKPKTGSDSDDEEAVEDDFKEHEDEQAGIEVKKDPKTRTTIRHLRIREDTAKYLRNLDPSSAAYDPKSRSMHENPTPDDKTSLYTGDSEFVRASSEVEKFNSMQNFSFTAMGFDPDHLTSAPSATEYRFRSHATDTQKSIDATRSQLEERYGVQKESVLPPHLRIAQSDEYVEYTSDGKEKRGKNGVSTIPKSRYPEDQFINNHTAIFGSYYESGKWGFACCRNFLKNSYCTGTAGVSAKSSAPDRSEIFKKEEKEEGKREYAKSFQQEADSEAKEMEAYHLRKKRMEDPMANFIETK